MSKRRGKLIKSENDFPYLLSQLPTPKNIFVFFQELCPLLKIHGLLRGREMRSMVRLGHVPIKDLVRCPIQLRPVLKNTLEYIMLKKSIEKNGLLQPLLVRENEQILEVVDGGNRYECCHDLDIKTVPCLIGPMTDKEVLRFQLICNARRIQASPVEYARRLWRILKVEQSMTLNELAHSIDQHPSWVKTILKMVNLSEKAKKFLTDGKLGVKMGAELSNLPVERQDSILELLGEIPKSEFRELIRREGRHLRQGQKKARSINNLTEDHKLRNLKEIKNELKLPTIAASVLSGAEASTALEGWKAALEWCTRTDKDSIAKELKKRESVKAKKTALLKKQISEKPTIERELPDG